MKRAFLEKSGGGTAGRKEGKNEYIKEGILKIRDKVKEGKGFSLSFLFSW